MKIITVSGSHSNVGKTTLARKLKSALSDYSVEVVKLGHGEDDPDKDEQLFVEVAKLLEYIEKLERLGMIDFLIIESNTIHEHLKPDFSVFIKGNLQMQKSSSSVALKNSDLVILDSPHEVVIDEMMSKLNLR